MKRKLLYVCAVLLLPVLVVSCYPDDADYVDELDIAMTNYDEKADFSAIRTLAMPDSVVVIGENKDMNKVSHRFDAQILSLVKKNLSEYGYTFLSTDEIKDGKEPDGILTVSAFTSSYFIYGDAYPWYDYWGWYPWGIFDWYYPGMRPAYIWYPVASYQTGSVSIEMLDPKKADKETQRIPVIWSGVVNGILAGSDNYIEQRLEKNIGQCFVQSPYLKH